MKHIHSTISLGSGIIQNLHAYVDLIHTNHPFYNFLKSIPNKLPNICNLAPQQNLLNRSDQQFYIITFQ